MAVAQIRIDQPTNPQPIGIAGRARTDIILNQLVQLRNTDNTGVQSYRWTILDQPDINNPVQLSNPIAAAPTFTPTVEGSYTIRLEINDGLSSGEIAETLVAILDSDGLRIPAAGESTEDNSLDSTGVENPRGWQPAIREYLEFLKANIGGGGPAPDLDAVLTAGNTTGSNPIQVSSGSSIIGLGTLLLTTLGAGTSMAFGSGDDLDFQAGGEAFLTATLGADFQAESWILRSTSGDIELVSGGNVEISPAPIVGAINLNGTVNFSSDAIVGGVSSAGVSLDAPAFVAPELGSAPRPDVAGFGQFWVQSGGLPFFRDALGNDIALGAGSLARSFALKPPSSPSPFDNEFDATIADFAVVDPSATALVQRDANKNQASIVLPGPAAGVQTCLLARDAATGPGIPAQPYTIWARVSLYGPRLNFYGAGVFVGEPLADLSTTGSFRACLLFSQTGGGSALKVADLSFGAWNGPIAGGFTTVNVEKPSMYVGIHVDAAGDVWPVFSSDGEGVQTVTNARFSPGFPIDTYGLALYTDANGAAIGPNQSITANFDFLRVANVPIDFGPAQLFENLRVPSGEILV